MTFAEWHAKQPTFGVNAERLAHDAWDAATTEANSRAGDAANEAEKVERREVAVDELAELYESDGWNGKTVDAIIKIAQG